MRLIDADALMKRLKEDPLYPLVERYNIEGAIDAEPTIEERKTGHWIHDGSHWANRWICDKCGYKLFGVKTKFCPDCGQRM